MMVMDLFSGIGGFSLGLERAGMQTAAFCEIEPYARRVLAKHWPEVPIYEDIRTVTAAGLAADGIAADVICGGFPCQDLSLAGAGAGLSGGRSGLWFEYLRLIGEVRPQFAIIENVSALRSRGLDTVLRGLAEIGYDAEWHCIPASAVGAPHRRDRIWIVAYPGRLSGSTGREAGYVAGSQGACEADCEQRQRNGNAADDSGSDVAHPVSERREWWEGYPQRRISNRPAAGRSEDTDGSFAEGEGCGAGHVANSDRAGLAQWESERGYPCPQLTSVERTDWWLVEPDICRGFDGFSAWLDRSDVVMDEAHEYIITHANAEKTGPREILRTLRGDADPSCLQRSTGGQVELSAASVLFAFLWELEKRLGDPQRASMASAAIAEPFVRGVRDGKKPASSSREPGSVRQSAREHPDALQALSRLLARCAEKAWLAYRRSDAAAPLGWESGVARVANGVPARVHRLRCLGNSIVPQIAEMIGRAIMERAA